jgi:hypothetical protein
MSAVALSNEPVAATQTPTVRAGRIDWLRGVLQASLLGLAVTALETAAVGAAVFATHDRLRFFVSIFAMWTTRAMPLAWTAQWVEGRWSARAIAAVFAIELTLAGLLWDSSPWMNDWATRWLGALLPARANFLYTAWVMLVYGGAFFLYCLFAQRALRVRGLLARAEFERGRSAALANSARIEAVEGRIDPALMLRALGTLRARYAQGRDGAEAILDALVTFLRLAMPAVRCGSSTLHAELALLGAYSDLLAKLDGGRRVCRVSVGPHQGDLPFPPLLLIPLIERLRSRQPDDAPPVGVTLRDEGANAVLQFDAGTVDARWIGEPLAQRLERTLCTQFESSSARARWQAGPSPALTLRLPLPASPQPGGSP